MFTKKLMTAIGVITAILSLIGGIWAFESHYATKEYVDDLEIQIAGALQNQQHKSNAQFFRMMIDSLTRKLSELRREMRRNPNDDELQRDYDELLQERDSMKKQLDEAIRKIS